MKRSIPSYSGCFASCLSLFLILDGQASAADSFVPSFLGAVIGFGAERNISYVDGGGRHQQLDICYATKGKDRPLIVWIHGGGWKSGSKEQNPALFLVREGYAVASINYRLTDRAPWPAQIEDCKAAIRYLRAHASRYRIDPDRIGVWGGSAGGHLAAMLGTTSDTSEFETRSYLSESSSVQAVCDWFGPANLEEDPQEKSITPVVKSPYAGAELVTALLGGSPAERVEMARNASPVTFASADDPPFLIMHGEDDRLVPVAQSKQLARSLKKVGVPVKLKIVPGIGHAGRDWLQADLLDQVQSFFDKNLKS